MDNVKRVVLATIAATQIFFDAGIFYPRTFIVSEIDLKNDIVTVEDFSGYTFQFYNVEDYEVGDIVAAVMYNHLTPEITDDVIVSTRYNGYLVEYGGTR